MDMMGTWTVKSLYRAALLVTVLKELSKYKLDSVGVQAVSWVGCGTEPAVEYIFFVEKVMRIMT
jgi:hypothetical protein